MRRLTVILILIVCAFAVQGQDTVRTVSDSAKTAPAVRTHSPGKAALMSAIVPSMGQFYNRQWWKAPIIYAGAAAITYFAIVNNNGRSKFKTEYYNRVNGTGDLLPDYANYTNTGIYNLYTSYKNNFQLCIILACALYAVNIADAYVYGYLFSFDISDDLSLNISPYYIPEALSFTKAGTAGLSFKFSF